MLHGVCQRCDAPEAAEQRTVFRRRAGVGTSSILPHACGGSPLPVIDPLPLAVTTLSSRSDRCERGHHYRQSDCESLRNALVTDTN